MSEPTVLLTADQVADRLQMPIETLKYWRSQGKGPRFFRMGRHVRYIETDLEAWIRQQRDVVA